MSSYAEKGNNAARDLEGKIQEAAGKLTDNAEAQAQGKAKQAETPETPPEDYVKGNLTDKNAEEGNK
ncbi:MAG: hypothetical protein WBA76_14815 [Phormidesmis sp.]